MSKSERVSKKYKNKRKEKHVYEKKKPSEQKSYSYPNFNGTYVTCSYCGEPCSFVGAETLKPDVTDATGTNYWQCKNCDAYVTCHKRDMTHGLTGIEPMGVTANRELRRHRGILHKAFDRIWRRNFMPRGDAYAWLADKMGMTKEECHIAMMDDDQCLKALNFVREIFNEPRAIEWYKLGFKHEGRKNGND